MSQAGGLAVPEAPGISERLEQEILEAWDTFDQAELELTKDGWAPMDKPQCDRPSINPGNLTKLNGDQVTALFEQVVAWHGYAANMLSRVRGGILQINNQQKHLSAVLRQGIIEAYRKENKKKPSDPTIKESISLDPKMIELEQQKQKLEQKRFELDGWIDTLYEYRKAVSRQVEIRRQEIEGLSGGRAYGPQAQPHGHVPGRFPR